MPLFKGKKSKQYTYHDVTGSLHELRRRFHWQPAVNTVRDRMRKGMSLEQAADTPLNEYQRNFPESSRKALKKAQLVRRLQRGKQEARKQSLRPLQESTCHPWEVRERCMVWKEDHYELK